MLTKCRHAWSAPFDGVVKCKKCGVALVARSALADGPVSNWQRAREMAPREYREVLAQLELSRAAAGRYLGISARTSRRYAHGDAEVPAAQVLLLRALLVLASVGVKPVVPRWRPEQN